MAGTKEEWDYVITGSKKGGLGFKQLYLYKDLLFLLVKRDLVTIYKQTVLGPIWLILQPLLTALTFTLIFGRVAGLSTDGTPQFLFYYSGVVMWSFFAECLLKTADTFVVNADLFSKVFFPRLIMPLSVVFTAMVKFGINFAIFIALWIFYKINGWHQTINAVDFFYLPLLIFFLAGMGMGIGIIISSLTAKYKDFKFLLQFGVQLMMYLSPIIYPLSILNGSFKTLIHYNPITPVIETTRYIFLNKGYFTWVDLGYTCGITIVILLAGIIIFNRTEKSFIDTV